MIKFESDSYITLIKSRCVKFLSKVQSYPGGKFLRFSDELGTEEHPGRIVQEYHSTALLLNSFGYRVETDDEVIDKYLFIALYIRAFLHYQPFSLDAPDNPKLLTSCKYTIFPNEYFIIVLIEAIFRFYSNDNNGQLRLDDKYQDEFIETLSQYKMDLNLFNPISFSEKLHEIEQRYFYKSTS